MSDLEIKQLNASSIQVITSDDSILLDLYELLRFEEPTFSKNKHTRWDGVVRLFNKETGILPYGLLEILLKHAHTRGWTMSVDPAFKNDLVKIEESDLAEWIKTLNIHSKGKAITPYEYQIEAVHLAVRFSRLVALAATSAGKSLIAYILCRYYQAQNNGGKTLLVVPTINLVNQMSRDFEDYSSHNGFDCHPNIHCIAEGVKPYSDKPIFISTWQSIQDMPPAFFEQFENVIVDEVHGATGKKLQYIMNCCVNAFQRVGMTGTLKSDKLSPTLIQSLFGPIKRIVRTRELQDAGRASETLVTMMQLEYTQEERKHLSNLNYQEEIDFLLEHPYRNKVIKTLAKSLKGNSLIMFDRIESHLEVLFEEIKKEDSTKHYYMIHGEIKPKIRDEITALAEAGNDIVIFGSGGTMSTGISVRKLHNLVIAHPTKSIIKILQSLGRMIRLHESKSLANIYHLVDFAMYSGRQNYSLRHGLEAYAIYRSEDHRMVTKKIEMKAPTYDISVFVDNQKT